ncbi:uncharacterized protein TNCV_1015221 [Trichonephila clavipes]|uniref:Transposase n=1 Tax=Trichonephila clavipes TaxID=2585209 RepID=A0A8X6VXZ4_TRICX|nr:uncharacterized protein TNCV_1015221 [Trichonephila clavipes]
MITNFFIPELNNHDVQDLWFQQDGATCHTARATIDLLKDTLGDRLISRFRPVNWPPRSCDLTPLDYFLWGYVKSLVTQVGVLDHEALRCLRSPPPRTSYLRPLHPFPRFSPIQPFRRFPPSTPSNRSLRFRPSSSVTLYTPPFPFYFLLAGYCINNQNRKTKHK